MTVSVSKAGPYYASGAISFSSLRSNFRAQVRRDGSGDSETFNTDNNPISASQLIRNTTTTETNPIVPDATENVGITSSQSNWTISDFRDSIKYYYVTLPSSDEVTNFDIDDQSWNSNLTKTINKVAFIDGICGSNSTSSAAARFNTTAYNITIDVFGEIYGAGGAGGTSSSTNGGNGGNALRASSLSGNNLVVNVRSGAKIYAGGGGGAKGDTGNQGSNGTCNESTTKSSCGNCPSCDSGWSSGGCTDGWHCDRKQVCNRWGNCWWESTANTKYRTCSKSTTVNGGNGGEGGDGGQGRGYDNLSGPSDGSDGLDGGGYGGCPGSWSPKPSNGDPGDPGGSGGDWASEGDDTDLASGGSPGKAIFGVNYTVTGSTGSTNIKGDY